MADKQDSDQNDALGGILNRARERMSDAMIDLWKLYQNLDQKERNILKLWIDKVVPLERCSPPSMLMGSVRVDLRYPINPEEVIRVTGVPAALIQRAIEGWEKGEKFKPLKITELG